MYNEKTPRCFLCHREGKNTRSEFLCEKCLLLALKHPLFKCSRCNSTGVITNEVMRLLLSYSKTEIEKPCVILTNYCANCIKENKSIELKIQIYRLDRRWSS